MVCDSKFSETHDRFNCAATEFLHSLFSGKISPEVFPDDLLTLKLEFVPYSEKQSSNTVPTSP